MAPRVIAQKSVANGAPFKLQFARSEASPLYASAAMVIIVSVVCQLESSVASRNLTRAARSTSMLIDDGQPAISRLRP